MKNITKTDRSGYLFDNRSLVMLIIPLVIEQLLGCWWVWRIQL